MPLFNLKIKDNSQPVPGTLSVQPSQQIGSNIPALTVQPIPQTPNISVPSFDPNASYYRPSLGGEFSGGLRDFAIPLANFGKGIISSFGDAAATPFDAARLGVANLTGNTQAADNARNYLGEDTNAVKGIARFLPQEITKVGLSARNPISTGPLLPDRTYTPNTSFTKFLLGDQPITSVGHDYNQDVQNSGHPTAFGNLAANTLGAYFAGKGTAEAGQLAAKPIRIAADAYRRSPANNQGGSILFPGTPGFEERVAAGEVPQKNVQGTPFVETSDRNAALNTEGAQPLLQGQAVRLGDVLVHPELERANPELMNTPVELMHMRPDLGGFFDPKTGHIVVNADRMIAALKSGDPAAVDTIVNTMLHEATHVAQKKAGNLLEKYNAAPTASFTDYALAPHEFDARNVTYRKDLSQEELARTPFYDTADAPVSAVQDLMDRKDGEFQANMSKAMEGNAFQRTPESGSVEDILNQRQQAREDVTKITLKDRWHRAVRQGTRMTFEDMPSVWKLDRTVNKLYKKATGKGMPESQSLVLHTDALRRSHDEANNFMREHGFEQLVRDVTNAHLDLNHLADYATDKRLLELAQQGRSVAKRDLAESMQVVEQLAPQYEPFAQRLTDYSHQLVNYLRDGGVITPEAAQFLHDTNPGYVPLQRLFTPEEMDGIFQGKGPAATLSKQTVVRRLEGSSREIKNPMESLINMTYSAAHQIEKNKGANIIYRLAQKFGNQLGFKILRNADNVRTRNELLREAGEYRQIREKTKRVISTRNRQAKKLATELNNLEKQGLLVRLRQDSNEVAKPGEAFRYATREALHSPKRLVDEGKKATDVIGAAKEVSGEVRTHLTITRGLTDKEMEGVIDGLIWTEPKELTKIRNMQGLRQAKLDSLMGEIRDLKDQFESAKREVQDRYSQASLLRDAETKGKSIITGWDKGTKFVVEVPHELRQDLDNATSGAISPITKALNTPARVARAGVTTFSLPFNLITNLIKDPVTGFINSGHGLRMLDPRTWTQAFIAVARHNDDFKNMLLKTYYDSGRQNTKLTLEEMASHANAMKRAKYLARHPEKTLRLGEDIVSTPEQFNRMWQAYANYYGGKAKGLQGEDLLAYTRKGAWYNTTNFQRAGIAGRELNMIDQFLNASIQGSRTLGRNIKERPAQTLTKIAVVAGIVPTIMTLNNLRQENKDAYNDIPDYIKQQNLVFIMPGAKRDPKTGQWSGIVKIPMSNEIARIADITRRGIEAHVTDGSLQPDKVLEDLVQTFTGQNVDSAMAIVGNFTPQFARDLIEPAMNKSMFTGQKIVPDNLVDAPKDQQFTKGTSGSIRILANKLHMSPLILENLIQSQLGTVGKELTHVSDEVLGHYKVIPQDQVKGKGVISDIESRVYGAQGTSDAARYAQGVQAARNSLATADDRKQFDDLMSKQRTPNGEKSMQELPADRLKNAGILWANDNIRNAVQKVMKAQPSHDPKWDLSGDQLKIFMDYEKQYTGDPAKTFIALQNPWIKDVVKKQQDYYNSNKFDSTSVKQGPQYPKIDDNTQALLDQLDNLDSAGRAQLYDAHPEVLDAFSKIAQYVNEERKLEGAPELADHPTADPATQAIIDAYNKLPQHDGPKGGNKTRSLWIQSHPDLYKQMTDYYTQDSVWSAAKNAALAMYKGGELNQAALKSIYSLGNYDIQKNADGTYSLGSKGVSSGGSSSGSGGYYTVSSGGKTYRVSSSKGFSASGGYSDYKGTNGYYEPSSLNIPASRSGVQKPAGGKTTIKKYGASGGTKLKKISVKVPKRATRLV